MPSTRATRLFARPGHTALVAALVVGAPLVLGSTGAAATSLASGNGNVAYASSSNRGTVLLNGGTLHGGKSVNSNSTILSRGGAKFTVSIPASNLVSASCTSGTAKNPGSDEAKIMPPSPHGAYIQNESGTITCSFAGGCHKNEQGIAFNGGEAIGCDPVVVLTTKKRSTKVKVIAGYAVVTGQSGLKGETILPRRYSTTVMVGHDPTKPEKFVPTAAETGAAAAVETIVPAPAIIPAPPMPTLTSAPPAPPSASKVTTATFRFSSPPSKQPLVYACAIDGGPFQLCTSPVTYDHRVQGSHTFQVFATNAGGSASAVRTYKWNVNPLFVYVTSSPKDGTNQTTAVFRFHATGQVRGVTFTCTVDNRVYPDCKSGDSFPAQGGTNTFSIKGTDGASDTYTINLQWTVVVPPGAPTGLMAKAVSTTEIDLSWTAPSGGTTVASYNIYRSPSQSPVGNSTKTSYPDTGLTPGTTYTYTVTAVDASGDESSMSTTVTATTLPT